MPFPGLGPAAPSPERKHHGGRGGRPGAWASWLVGLAALAAVILAAVHFSEEREFAALAERAQPWWLALAFVFQAGTYLAQGDIWRRVAREGGASLSLGLAYRLSLAKLFLDQALPSAGISGTVVVARTLEQREVPRTVVMAAVVVNTVSYYAAFLLGLALALLLSTVRGHGGTILIAVATLFGLFGLAMISTALALAGRRTVGPDWLVRIHPLQRLLGLLGEAEPHLAHSVRLNLRSTLDQLAIILLDAATIWVLIRSLGETASPSGVYASFMLSTLLRTIGVIPGGLGTFEAASVVTLKVAGVPVAVALSATLLFRGLSFWLPMIPGLLLSRGLRRTP